MPITRPRRLAVLLTSAALLLGACASDEVPEVDDLAGAATETVEPSPESEPSPTATEAPSPEPEPSPSPCPEGQQRVAPGGDCFTPSPQPAPEPEPEPAAESEPAPQPEPAPAACDREARTFTVVATNFAYSPGSLGEICTGDTIVMDNQQGTHTLKDEATGRETGAASEGSTASLSVQETGSYDFFCGLHPSMRTAVEVVG